MTIKADIGVMQLEAQECLRFPANPQKLRFQRLGGPADTLISDSQHPEIQI